jgi:predicted TIM-barrel fold metal-dependent hydrolase
MLKDYPNYYWCTSSTLCLRGAVEKIVKLGCTDKLLYGSDFPLNSFSLRLGSMLAADISDEDMKKILGGNAVRLLNLDMEEMK